MKNVFHRKMWNVGVVEQHMDLPLPPLIKIKHDYKSDKYFLQLKFRRDPTSEKTDLY